MGKSGYGSSKTDQERKRDLRAAIASGRLKVTKVRTPVAVSNGTVTVGLSEKELPDFTQAVNAGAVWLDETAPGWYRAIDTSSLDLDDENHCVLGQAWSMYKNAEDTFFTGKGGLEDFRTNFKSFLAKAFGSTDSLTNKRQAAQYGFAFPVEVYDWINGRAAELVESGADKGMLKDEDFRYEGSLYFNKNVSRDRQSALAWKLNAECWEHLTTTWLVLIKAKQERDAQKLAAAKVKLQSMKADELAQLLVDSGKV